jgi:murein tripeptide amidase MpaA
MPKIDFDRFYRYEELTQLLQSYASEFPHLARVESIGKSYEGREIWLLTVTNFESGPDTEKPAVWVDGNIHASEVTTATACLYYLHSLLTGYGEDADITHCLNTRAFYICPRINPDGAEWALAERPKIIRSSTRPYPYAEDPVEGLVAWEDIDGDGRILTMRVRDPNGGWKVHPDDPRWMIRRDPIERGGTYYRLLPEGTLLNYDGVTIKVIPPKQGLDLNRNFPLDWRQQNEQQGAGPYPVSEPEVRAVVEFIIHHNNIGAAISLHTTGGLLLRPYDHQADEAFPAEDLWTYQKIGQKGTEITGYPNISVYHDFRYHPKQVTSGTFDWTYEHLGMFVWTVEIWAPIREAGISGYKYIDWFREHPLEDDLKMMQWNDEKLGGKGVVAWAPYQHPQLGEVELGGWDWMNVLINPPLELLEKEISRLPGWLTWHALISPKLEVRELSATHLGEDVYRVRLVVDNTGWLPTYVTKKALEKKTVRGIICEIELPEGATLASGLPRRELGQLEGQAYKSATPVDFDESTSDRLKEEWFVRAPDGGSVKITTRHERAGVVRATVALR